MWSRCHTLKITAQTLKAGWLPHQPATWQLSWKKYSERSKTMLKWNISWCNTHIHNSNLLSPFKQFPLWKNNFQGVIKWVIPATAYGNKWNSFHVSLKDFLRSHVDLHWQWKQMLAETAVNILQKLTHCYEKLKNLWTSSKKVLLYSPTDGCLIKNQTSPFEACLKIQCLSEGITSLFTQIPTAHIHISAFHNKDWWQEEENAIVYEIKGQRKRKGKDIYMKLYSKESPSVVLAFDALAFILAHNLTHGITIFWCWKDIYTQCYFWWLLKNIPSHAGI